MNKDAKYTYNLLNNYCELVFYNNMNKNRDWSDRDNYTHYKILDDVLNFMSLRGFVIDNDITVDELIRKDYFRGKKKDLEFKAHKYPTGFQIEFFQNVNYENRHGGEYDFDKYDKMPYLIRLSYINETNKIMQLLNDKGCINITEDYKLAEDKIKHNYAKSWHHKQNDMNFNLSDLDGKTDQPLHNTEDRDGKEILNGQVKYFRNYDGRLMRCRVYHNINTMWWCILSDTELRNVASFNLFDATEEDFKQRRLVKDVRPRFKYTVITSQYAYSYHSFICKMDLKTWSDNAKDVARELIRYKANDNRIVEDKDLGDLTYWKNKTIKFSYNVNSCGDIYFRNADTLEEAQRIVEEWNEQSKNVKGMFRRKGMCEEIRKRHNKNKIKKIVEKYFEIV